MLKRPSLRRRGRLLLHYTQLKTAIVAMTALAVLASALLAQTTWFANRHSVTYDETIYLDLMFHSVKDRRLDPRFMRLGVAPLPVLLTYAGPLYANRAFAATVPVEQGAPTLIRTPRLLNSLLIGVPLVALIFEWLRRRRGLLVAALGGGLAALSPTIVAHAALATTDENFALFSMLGIAAIAWCAAAPGAVRLLVCAVAIAAAMSAKYSGVFLLPVAAAAFLLSAVRRRSEPGGRLSVARAIGAWVVPFVFVVSLVLPLWWGAHLFQRATPEALAALKEGPRLTAILPAGSVRDFIQSVAPIAGLEHQVRHSREGENAFLLGERSMSGWWYYFPCMFLFKSTPAELSLAVFLLVTIGVSARHPWRTLKTLDSSMQCFLLAAAVLIALLVSSNLNIGHRYMIPLYPILIVAGCDRLAARLGHRRAWLAAAAGVLVLAQAWSSFSIAPHYLAYVNRPSGGPENGWRLMADSSLDWGQALPDLRAYLDAHPREPVAMKYFGSALPQAYGVNGDDMEHLARPPGEYALFALSVTYLNGLHLGGRDPFVEFRRLEPSAQVGYSIMVYDLRRPDAQFAFREALKIMP